MTEIVREYETPMCEFTLFRKGDKEFWNCHFKSNTHPVNKKFFKMSGAQPVRDINKIFIHCSASDADDHDRAEVIKDWHLQRGFSDIGYHYFIRKDGTLENGRPLDKIPAAQKGHNDGSIAICLSGLDHFTEKQFSTLRQLCYKLDDEYDVTFHGHREVSNKTCPNFDYKSILRLDMEGRMDRTPIVIPQPKKPSLWRRILILLGIKGEE